MALFAASLTRLSASSRLSLIYGALFLTMGIYTPYWPLWLESKGLTPSDITLILAASVAAKVAASPFISHYQDRKGTLHRSLPLFAALSLIGFGVYTAMDTFLGLLILAMITAVFLPNMVPITDALSAHLTRSESISYARVRVWGSITFMMAALFVGQALDVMAPENLSWVIMASLVLLTGICCLSPKTPKIAEEQQAKAPIGRVLAHPNFKSVLFASLMIQTGHAAYYALSSLHWLSLGHSSLSVGLLWAWGIMAEILLFWFLGKRLQNYKARSLLLFTALCALVRWVGTAHDPSLGWLFVLQTFHAITFGLCHLSVQHFITRNIPETETATAHALYSSLAMGVGHVVALSVIGLLYEQYGGGAFYFSAALALPAIAAMVLARRKRAEKAHP